MTVLATRRRRVENAESPESSDLTPGAWVLTGVTLRVTSITQAPRWPGSHRRPHLLWRQSGIRILFKK